MTREQKLALIVGFSLILLVGVLISDHLSRARAVQVAGLEAEDQDFAAATRPNLPEAVHPTVQNAAQETGEPQPVTGPSIEPSMPSMDPTDGSAVTTSNPTELASAPTGGGTLIAMGPATADQGQGGLGLESVGGLTDATRQLIEEFRDTAQTAMADTGLRGVNIRPATNVERVSEPSTSVPESVGSPTPPPQKVTTTWYTVKPGETLFQIAKRQYGSGQAWKQLAELNKGRVSADGAVRAGAKIELFDSLPGTATAKTPAKPTDKPADKPSNKPAVKPSSGDQRITRADKKSDAPSSGTYIVRKGDSLGTISQRVLGTVRRKDEILDLNQSVVDDEDSIQVGMVLKMPAR